MKIKIVFLLGFILLLVLIIIGLIYFINNKKSTDKNKFVEFTGTVTQSTNYCVEGSCLIKVDNKDLEVSSATPFIAVGQKVSVKALLTDYNLLTATCKSCYIKLLSPVITPIR